MYARTRGLPRLERSESRRQASDCVYFENRRKLLPIRSLLAMLIRSIKKLRSLQRMDGTGLQEAVDRVPVRLLSCCVMPN